MERRLKLTLEYDGTLFHGWQRQPGVRTVQETVAEALRSLTREAMEVQGASRTDRGVHALGQVAHCTTSLPIPLERLGPALNGRLPRDVRIRAVEEVGPQFHARFSAVAKRYGYLVDRGVVASVFSARYALHFPGHLDLAMMRRAAGCLLGERDFAALRSNPGSAEERARPTVRTLYRVTIEEAGSLLRVRVLGSGFLYRMMRNLVGSLLEVGRGRWTPERFAEGVASRDRSCMGPTAAPEGLCLERVHYDPAVVKQEAGEGAVRTPEEGPSLRSHLEKRS